MTELMKGHKWRDHKAKMTYPAYAEIKYDEIRCHVVCVRDDDEAKTVQVSFLSYSGKPLNNLDKFCTGFAELCLNLGITEFDCGVLVNDNFNDSYRYVRSKKVPEGLEDAHVQFILFDLPTVIDADYLQRCYIRNVVVCHAVEYGLPMGAPNASEVKSEAEVDALFLVARSKGYEGLMVKSTKGMYLRGKRTYDWLKVKPDDDADGFIIDVIEAVSAEGVPLGRAGSVTLEIPGEDGEDNSFASPHGIPHELGELLWNKREDYMGRWVEFKFMERDRQGGYRHPVWGRLREAKA